MKLDLGAHELARHDAVRSARRRVFVDSLAFRLATTDERISIVCSSPKEAARLGRDLQAAMVRLGIVRKPNVP